MHIRGHGFTLLTTLLAPFLLAAQPSTKQEAPKQGVIKQGEPEQGGPQGEPKVPQKPIAKQRVAVFELTTHGMADGMHDSLMAVLTKAVANTGWLTVISRDEIATMLDAEAQKQMLGCSDTGCLAEIAGALDVDLLVAGSVAPLGEATQVSLQLINQRFANVMNRVSLTWPGAEERLPEAIEAAAQLLLLEPAKRPLATIIVLEAVEGTELFLDETSCGEASTSGEIEVSEVTVGIHNVRITADGHQAREFPIVARSGKTVRINGALEPTPFYSTWWFWGGIAAVAVVAVAVPVGILIYDDRGTVSVNAPSPVAQ